MLKRELFRQQCLLHHQRVPVNYKQQCLFLFVRQQWLPKRTLTRDSRNHPPVPPEVTWPCATKPWVTMPPGNIHTHTYPYAWLWRPPSRASRGDKALCHQSLGHHASGQYPHTNTKDASTVGSSYAHVTSHASNPCLWRQHTNDFTWLHMLQTRVSGGNIPMPS